MRELSVMNGTSSMQVEIIAAEIGNSVAISLRGIDDEHLHRADPSSTLECSSLVLIDPRDT